MYKFTIKNPKGTLFKLYAPTADEAYGKICEIYDNPYLVIDLEWVETEEVGDWPGKPVK